MTNPCVQEILTRKNYPPTPPCLETRQMSCTCLSFMVNVCRRLLYPCLQFTEGCSQRHSRVHPLTCRILMLCSFHCFYLVSNWVNVTHESIRDVTIFSMLICFVFERNLLNKKITLEKEECKRTVLLNKMNTQIYPISLYWTIKLLINYT